MRLTRSVPALGPRGGFSLVEILLAVSVLAAGTLVLSKTLAASSRLSSSTRERSAAADAARLVLEEMQDQDFAQVFALYNASPDDDPAGAGTAPGSGFAVEGLRPLDDDADGLVGEILFPVKDGELREDLDLPQVGLPRDLDGLNGIDGDDHADDYRLLPVLVRVSWRGSAAPMRVELRTILAQR